LQAGGWQSSDGRWVDACGLPAQRERAPACAMGRGRQRGDRACGSVARAVCLRAGSL